MSKQKEIQGKMYFFLIFNFLILFFSFFLEILAELAELKAKVDQIPKIKEKMDKMQEKSAQILSQQSAILKIVAETNVLVQTTSGINHNSFLDKFPLESDADLEDLNQNINQNNMKHAVSIFFSVKNTINKIHK